MAPAAPDAMPPAIAVPTAFKERASCASSSGSRLLRRSLTMAPAAPDAMPPATAAPTALRERFSSSEDVLQDILLVHAECEGKSMTYETGAARAAGAM